MDKHQILAAIGRVAAGGEPETVVWAGGWDILATRDKEEVGYTLRVHRLFEAFDGIEHPGAQVNLAGSLEDLAAFGEALADDRMNRTGKSGDSKPWSIESDDDDTDERAQPPQNPVRFRRSWLDALPS